MSNWVLIIVEMYQQDVSTGHRDIDSRMHPRPEGSGCIRNKEAALEMSERHLVTCMGYNHVFHFQSTMPCIHQQNQWLNDVFSDL